MGANFTGVRSIEWGHGLARRNIIQKPAFPAKAGIHFSTARSPDEWIPACAGNADFQLVTPSPKCIGSSISERPWAFAGTAESGSEFPEGGLGKSRSGPLAAT